MSSRVLRKTNHTLTQKKKQKQTQMQMQNRENLNPIKQTNTHKIFTQLSYFVTLELKVKNFRKKKIECIQS